MQDVNHRELGEEGTWHTRTPYLLFNFSVHLKLLQKIKPVNLQKKPFIELPVKSFIFKIVITFFQNKKHSKYSDLGYSIKQYASINGKTVPLRPLKNTICSSTTTDLNLPYNSKAFKPSKCRTHSKHCLLLMKQPLWSRQHCIWGCNMFKSVLLALPHRFSYSTHIFIPTDMKAMLCIPKWQDTLYFGWNQRLHSAHSISTYKDGA